MSDPAYENQAPQLQDEQIAAPSGHSEQMGTPMNPSSAGVGDEGIYQPPELEQPNQESIDEDVGNYRPVPRVAIQAFCESESVSTTIDYTSRDRRMSKAHVKVQLWRNFSSGRVLSNSHNTKSDIC